MLSTARPATANVYSGQKQKKMKAQNKKSDPVSRFQSMQAEWGKQKFLKCGGDHGQRKLELDRFNKWRVLADTVNEKQAV